jgi:hypothetical protein
VGEYRRAEGTFRINHDVCTTVLGKMDESRSIVSSELDPLQIALYDFREHALPTAYYHKLQRSGLGGISLSLRVVVQDLGTVRESRLDARACCKPSSFCKKSSAGRIRCSGPPARLRAVSTNASANPTNGMVAPFLGAREVTIGPPAGRVRAPAVSP